MLLARLLTLRSFRSRPLRSFLSTSGIVLGVAGMLAISIANMTAMESIAQLFRDTSGNSSLIITAADASEQGFSERIIRQLSKGEGIDSAVPSIQIKTVLADDMPPTKTDVSFFGTTMGGLFLYGIDPALETKARIYEVVDGDFLEPTRPDAYEVVLVQSFADENNIEVAENIEILTPYGIERLQVVGLIAKEGLGRVNNGAFGVIPLKTAQTLFDRQDELDQIDVVVDAKTGTGSAIERLRLHLQTLLGSDYSIVYPAAQGKRMTQMLGNYQIGLNFLSGVALFVGVFLIYNAFSMNVVERTREWGMLRTIGMTRRQVTNQVLGEAAILGTVGSLLGVGFGIVLASGLTRVMEAILGLELGNIKITGGSLAASLSVGMFVTLLAATIPAWQAGRISPMDALRIRGTHRGGWLIQQGWKLGIVLLTISTFLLISNPFPYDVQFRLGSLTVFFLFFGGTLLIPVSIGAWEWAARPFIRFMYGNCGRLGSGNIHRG